LCRDVADEQLREAHAGEDARWQLADGRPVVGREVEQRRRRQEGTCLSRLSEGRGRALRVGIAVDDVRHERDRAEGDRAEGDRAEGGRPQQDRAERDRAERGSS